jgi:hypothetical protein
VKEKLFTVQHEAFQTSIKLIPNWNFSRYRSVNRKHTEKDSIPCNNRNCVVIHMLFTSCIDRSNAFNRSLAAGWNTMADVLDNRRNCLSDSFLRRGDP